MKKVKVLVKVIYFTEENDLVVHCPQLAIYGVCEGVLKDNLLNDRLVLDCFEEKLGKQLNRFPNEVEFLENLLIHGHWSINHGDFGPRPLKYYVDHQALLKRMIDSLDCRIIHYEFVYTQEILDTITEISNRINSMLQK